MKGILLNLLRLSLLGSMLSVALILLRLVSRGRISRTVYYYLWIPVLLRLCIPVGITLALPSGPETVPAPTPVFVSPAENPAPLPAGETDDFPVSPVLPAPGKSFSGSLREFLKSPRLWAGLWGLGTLACLNWYIGGYLCFSCKVRRSFRKPSPEALAVLQGLDPAGRVKLVKSRLVHTPLLLGLLQPVIVLPTGVEDMGRLRDILSHELTHARRFDLLYKWFAAVVVSLHWFNPIMILVRREISCACELSCDEAVVGRMDREGRRHYGETLLEVSSGAPSGQGRLAITLCEEKRHLKERLTAIAQYQKKGVVSVLVSLLLALGMVGCSLVSGAETQESPAHGDAYDAFRSALLGEGERQILCYLDGEASPRSVNITEVPDIFSLDSEYAAVWQFSVVDLDGDGQSETVLQVIDAAGDMGGFLVLRWEDGGVYGYPRSYREFESLKTDGTYGFSNPMGTEWGVCTVSFDRKEYSVQPIFSGRTDSSGQEVGYSVYGQPGTEEEYNAAADQQAKKPDAAWYEFTDENIRRIFSGDSPLSLLPASGNVLTDAEAMEAAAAMEKDFMEYWEVASNELPGMILPTVNVFSSTLFEGMDMAVFVVYPEYKTTKTVVYSITGSTVKRLGDIPSGFAFELSSANGGSFHTSWTMEAHGVGEITDAYYVISPDGITQTLFIGASTSDGVVLKGNLYQDVENPELEWNETLTVEEYDSRIGKANKDFVYAQSISFEQKAFRANAGFDLSPDEDGLLADYIFGQISNVTDLPSVFQSSQPSKKDGLMEPEHEEEEEEVEPSNTPGPKMDEEQRRYRDAYLLGWNFGSPFNEEFTENDDPVAEGKLHFIFKTMFCLEHPDNGNELLEKMTVLSDNGYTFLVCPAKLVDDTITAHFNTTVQAIRRNLRYSNKDYYDEETDAYYFSTGYGGVGSYLTVSGIHQQGDLLELEYNEFLPGIEAEYIRSGVVTIRLLPDGGWKYIANKITSSPAGGRGG